MEIATLYDLSNLRGSIIDSGESEPSIAEVREILISARFRCFRDEDSTAWLIVENKGRRSCEFHFYADEGTRGRKALDFVGEVKRHLRVTTDMKFAFNKSSVDDRQKTLMIGFLIKYHGGKRVGVVGNNVIFRTRI